MSSVDVVKSCKLHLTSNNAAIHKNSHFCWRVHCFQTFFGKMANFLVTHQSILSASVVDWQYQPIKSEHVLVILISINARYLHNFNEIYSSISIWWRICILLVWLSGSVPEYVVLYCMFHLHYVPVFLICFRSLVTRIWYSELRWCKLDPAGAATHSKPRPHPIAGCCHNTSWMARSWSPTILKVAWQ